MTREGRPIQQPGALGEEIARLYLREERSLREIGVELGISHDLVGRYLEGMGIQRRSLSEADEIKERRKKETKRTVECPWPGCTQMKMLAAGRFRAGMCVTHLKIALGLMEPA